MPERKMVATLSDARVKIKAWREECQQLWQNHRNVPGMVTRTATKCDIGRCKPFHVNAPPFTYSEILHSS